MLQVTHEIKIGSDKYKSPANSRLVCLAHSARMDTLVNTCRITMAPAFDLSFSPDDAIEVNLGNGDTDGIVFKGKIRDVDWNIERTIIEAYSSSALLLNAWYNLYFEQTDAGTIVNNLCSEAGVSAGQVDTGLNFEYYAIGSHKSAADHIRLLAVQCGMDTYMDNNDQLVFSAYVPGSPVKLEYGINVISMSLDIQGEGIGTTAVFGDSPASFGKGSSAATWLTKNDVNASYSSGGGSQKTIFDPTVRTIDQANLVAQNYHMVFQPSANGVVTIPGNPGISMGDTVEVSSMPAQAQNGTYKVAGIEHRITKEKGFITNLLIEST